jgi:NAD(P)-dependent dehydrogenase (short-subunit alcohol dehydrogenase family)
MSGLSIDLAGKVALVVGATGAIGQRTAALFARAGAKVALAGRDEAKGSAVLETLTAAGAEAMFVACDVTDSAAMERVVAEAVGRFGRIDCAFNNAGWEGNAAGSAEITEDDWQRMIDVKLSGTWRGLKYQARQMLAQGGGGAIVNMAGSWGLVGFPGYASYCAAAHGIMGLTRAAALDYAGAGLRINAVCPGAVDTPMLDRMVGGSEEVKSAFASAIPMGRLAVPQDVAQAVVWLCSDLAGYVSGQGIVLSGAAQ